MCGDSGRRYGLQRRLLQRQSRVSSSLSTGKDLAAGSSDLGYARAALIFAGLLAIVAVLWFWTKISRAALFWAAFILTRPLGATVGDFLDKPRDAGGLAVSRPLASLLLAAFIVVFLVAVPQHAASEAPRAENDA